MLAMPADTFEGCRHYFTETFAGVAAVTDDFRADDKTATALDLKYGQECNILGDLGYLNHVMKIVQTDVGVLFAPVCSSFGGINRATSKRSKAKPLGNQSLKYIKDANLMATRVVLLMWLCTATGLAFVLEQPQGSTLEMNPRFQEYMRKHKVYRKSIKMKDWARSLAWASIKVRCRSLASWEASGNLLLQGMWAI